MPRYTLNVNGEKRTVEVEADTPLLWVLRDTLGLTGTKYGCGQSLCGACTVHLDGEPIRSCVTKVADAARGGITTIEGLMITPRNPIRKAWIAEDVPQCGYCQPGMIMAVSALLAKNAKPGDDDIDSALAGHICRCGTYQRIRRAVHRAARSAASGFGRRSETPRPAGPRSPKSTAPPATTPKPDTPSPGSPEPDRRRREGDR
jgi:aerobic-type carbon monoxide dehydrogenase small subunit (CoxS/CutS family)